MYRKYYSYNDMPIPINKNNDPPETVSRSSYEDQTDPAYDPQPFRNGSYADPDPYNENMDDSSDDHNFSAHHHRPDNVKYNGSDNGYPVQPGYTGDTGLSPENASRSHHAPKKSNKNSLLSRFENDDIILILVIITLLLDDCDDKILMAAIGFIFFSGFNNK